MAKSKERETLPDVLKALLSAAATFIVLLLAEQYMYAGGVQTMSTGITKDTKPAKSAIPMQDGPWGTKSKSTLPAPERPKVFVQSHAAEREVEANAIADTFSSAMADPHLVADGSLRARGEESAPVSAEPKPKTRPPASKARQQPSQEEISSPGKNYPVEDTAGKCSQETYDAYRSEGKGSMNMLEWCRKTQSLYNVVLGRSWGSLPRNLRLAWDNNKCNELLTVGKLQSCHERWGWGSFDLWRANTKTVVNGPGNAEAVESSRVDCAVDIKTSTFCRSERVVVDFAKLGTSGTSRSFGRGFYTTYGERTGTWPDKPEIPGKRHISPESGRYDEMSSSVCDYVEKRPAFVISNDDIYNLGHYINDVAAVWNMAVLANRDTKKSILINIDGVRRGGPAGGPPHRLMEVSDPDRHGPYLPYYASWFEEVKKGVEYKDGKVCFREIYFQPFPGVPWFWNDWGQINECSVQAPSPLYQSFNQFLRRRWRDAYGSSSLTPLGADNEPVHVIIEVRAINKAKRNNHSTARYIRNLKELIAALEKEVENIKVTAQNFAALTFPEQVKLSHTMGILVSMHGAGTTHIFHAAVGSRNCCGLVELFPDKSIEFYTAHGYGNLARMHGFHHDRIVAEQGSTTVKGTTVNIPSIVAAVKRQALLVKQKPTCLHDVKDTTKPVYASDFGKSKR